MATAAPLVEPFLAWSHHLASAALVEAQAQFAASVGAEKTVDTEAGERQLSQSCDWKDGVQGGPKPSCFHSSERVTPNLEKRLCECSGGQRSKLRCARVRLVSRLAFSLFEMKNKATCQSW